MRFTPKIGFGLFCVALSVCAAEPTPAKPFLQVDFGTKSSPVKAGFVGAKAGVGHVDGPFNYEFEGYGAEVASAGALTLTVAGGASLSSTEKLCARDREEGLPKGSLQLGDLYRDFITGPSTLTIGISGLKPGAAYQVTVYSFDKNRALPMDVTDYSKGTRGTTVSIKPDGKKTSTDANPDAGRTAVLQAKAPASGQLVLRLTSIEGGSAVLNAISISAQ